VRGPALTFNEGKCCAAIMQLIEQREGSKASCVLSPEVTRHAAPVEMAFDIGPKTYAVEHTGIEPFAGFMQMSAEAKWRLTPIEDAVRNRLGQGVTFQLAIPVGALAVQKGADLRDAQNTITDWVVSAARTLTEAPVLRGSARTPAFRNTEHPFSMRLDRLSRELPGRNFYIVHSTTEQSLEQARRQRLRLACQKKLPKLQKWSQSGARSVLILEDNDIAATNETLVFEALKDLRPGFDYWPDEIYVVGTYIDEFWPIHTIWLGELDYQELSGCFETRSLVDPESLVDITAMFDAIPNS